MTSGTKVLVGEFFVAIAYSSWGALKFKYAPWPGNYVKIGLAFGMLGILAMASEQLASLLGAGFILGILVRDMSKGPLQQKPNLPADMFMPEAPFKPSAMGGVRPDNMYVPLYFGSS